MNEATAAGAHLPERATGIPVLPGLPVVGNLVPFLRDPMGLLLDGYRRLGPVFRIRVPRHRFTVLAGPEANVFAGRAGDLSPPKPRGGASLSRSPSPWRPCGGSATFALDPSDYRLKVRMDPTPTAGPGLRVRVLDARA
jgi:hypothetical protein